MHEEDADLRGVEKIEEELHLWFRDPFHNEGRCVHEPGTAAVKLLFLAKKLFEVI